MRTSVARFHLRLEFPHAIAHSRKQIVQNYHISIGGSFEEMFAAGSFGRSLGPVWGASFADSPDNCLNYFALILIFCQCPHSRQVQCIFRQYSLYIFDDHKDAPNCRGSSDIHSYLDVFCRTFELARCHHIHAIGWRQR